MDSKGLCYISYLLRLWPVQGEGRTIWRASLESPHTGERRGFATLADLFAFLERETGSIAQDEMRWPNRAQGRS